MSDEILIRAKIVGCGCDDYCDPQIVHDVVTVEQLLLEQHDFLLKSRGFALINPKQGSISKETAELLRSHGWVHTETAKNREDRKSLEQEYYLLDEAGKSYYYEPRFKKVDIESLTEDQLRQLARSGKIVQVVSPKSVLSPAQYKKLQTKRNQLEDQRLRAKAATAKKLEKKKQKEIAAAKKLLEEVGQ